MSDFNSELPIRTSLPGQVNYDDVVIKLGDATNPTTQQAAVDTHGSQFAVLKDSAGNLIADQLLSATYWLQSVSPSNGPTAPGTVAAFSNLIGGQYSASLPTLSTGQQSAIQVDSSGRLWANVTNLPLIVDTNYGTVGASTLRSAAQIGNSTGPADYNNGLPTAQTLRVAAQLAVAGANVSIANPIPVSVVFPGGSSVNDYSTVAALAAGASTNHDYAITASKTFYGRMFWAAGSGMIKAEVQISPDGTTFTSKWVGFNSTATPNIEIQLDNLVITETGTGAKIRIIMTNRDNKPQDVYSTISGTEQ